MTPRLLALALAALLPASAAAEDLVQTYQLARNSDPQFAAAESSRLATREGAVQARSALLPQVNGNASLSRSRTESSGTQVFGGQLFQSDNSQDATSRSIGVGVDQMIYDRANFTQLRSQQALGKASDYQLEAAGDSLMTRTSQAYFNVLVALETLQAARANEAALKQQADFADKRLEVGLAPITDVHEARARYESARAAVISTRAALEDALQALVEITGKPVETLKALPADFRPALPDAGGAEAWVQRAVENNPALIAQQYQLESSEQNVETARSGYFPRLYANGRFSDSRTNGSSTDNLTSVGRDFENQSRGPSVGVTLQVPIFNGGLTSSRVRQALAQRDVVQDQLEQQRRALVRNTRGAYNNLVAGSSEVEARRLAVVAARSAYDASQVGMEVGTRTVLDVLTNQQALFTAEREYALARYTYLQNRLLLEQAAGTLDVADLQDVNRLLTVTAKLP